ncbi:MAG: hypothetical protein KAT37_04785, partial [Candidatus Aenigmarchaeota archaeon]|nr:hypothetical protein [Candidatus Aenigmarchaeota archaeon]
EVAFAGNLGMDVDLSKVPGYLNRNDKVLFSESSGRFIVTVAPEYKENFEKILEGYDCNHVGYVNEGDEFKVRGLHDEELINESIGDLKHAYKKTFGDLI